MSCIYQIKNLVNDNFYIGSTQNSFLKRKGEHLAELRNNYHYNRHLQNAWNKYGEENFEFRIIEEFKFPNNCDRDYIYEYITDREMFYITKLDPEYNIARETRGGKLGRIPTEYEREHLRRLFTGRTVSDETKEKIRTARGKQIITEDHKNNISKKLKDSKFQLGRKQSIEQRHKKSVEVLKQISQGIGMHSELSKDKRTKTLKLIFNTPIMKQKLKESARNRNRTSFSCFKDELFVNNFTSQIEAAETLGFDKSWGISAVLNGLQHSHRGYNFIYNNI